MAYVVADTHRANLALPLIGVLMAVSSLVFIEPAPYDLLLVALLVVFLVRGMGIPREIRLPALLLGCFVLGNVLAALAAPAPLQSLRSLGIRTYMVVGWLFFVCVVAADAPRVLPVIWRGYLVAAAGAAAFGILEYYGFIKGLQWEAGTRLLAWEGGLRAKGPFKDANVFGPFLVPVALYCVSRLQAGLSWRGVLYLGLFLLYAFGILLSFSRGAWINFALSLVIFLVASFVASRSLSQKLGRLLAGTLVALAAAAVVIYAVTYTSAGQRFEQRAVLAQSYDVQAGGRFYTQKLAVQRVGRSPLGVGPGRADEVFGLEPHNLYLHVIVEGGWLAGFAFYGLVGITLYRATRLLAWRSPQREEALVLYAAMVGMLVQSAFIDSTHWRHLWLLLALASGLVVERQRTLRAGTAG